MQSSKFIVSYKYLDHSFSKKQILWALNHLKKIGNKYKIKILFNKTFKDSKKNSIFLFNSEKKLKKNFDIKVNLPKNKEGFAIIPYNNKILINNTFLLYSNMNK